jgi:hypothetical protein
MKVPLSATPFLMPDPNEEKPEFMIFRNMNQLHLCPACEKAFKLFLKEIDKMHIEEK